MGRRRVEMKRRGLKMAPKKVRRRGLHRLSSVRIVMLFFYLNSILCSW